MTPEDNLEKYFKKVLKEDELSETEWAIPSEDLWEAAKVHFPKKKKKDRVLFFWFGLGLFCLLSGISIHSFWAQNGSPDIEEQLVKKDRTIAPIQKEIKAYQPVAAEKSITPSEQQVIAAGTNKQPQTIQSIKSKKQVLKTTGYDPKNEQLITEIQNVKNINSESQSKNSLKQSENASSATPAALGVQKIVKELAVLNSLKKPITFLAIGERPLNIQDTLQNLIVPVTPKFKQWEVGLSYAPFILIQESILNNGSESPFGELTIGVKHQNLNFNIRRFLNRRFSISSGLNLSNGGLDFSICDNIINRSTNTNKLRYYLEESSLANQVELTNLGIDIDASIEYLAGVVLEDGDNITIKAEVPFNIRFVQMPVLFNVHFGKRKLKAIVHTGFSLDYQHTRVNDLSFNLFKGTQIISKPVVVEPLNQHSLKVRWQAGLGLRYAIKGYLQIGSAVNINISAPIFSRYNFGIYYGF